MKKKYPNAFIKKPHRQSIDLRQRSHIIVEVADSDRLLFPENVRKVMLLNDEMEKARNEAHIVVKRVKRKNKRLIRPT